MRELGLEPSADPSNSKNLQRSIALNRENVSGNMEGIEALARQLASLSDEQRAMLAAVLANKQVQTDDTSLHAVISPKRNRNSFDLK